MRLMKIKGFAVDIDGTLTDEDGTLDLDAAYCLRWLEKLGYRTILVSGRSIWEVYSLASYLGLTRAGVGENGGVVALPGFRLMVFGDKAKALEAYDLITREIKEVKLRTVLPRFTEVVLERTFPLELAEKIIKEHHLPLSVKDSRYAYHINSREVDKATGLKAALPQLGLKAEEMVAIGDSGTDVPLFEGCGYSVCLGDAPNEVKTRAKHATKAPFGRGLVEALQHIAEKFMKVRLEGED